MVPYVPEGELVETNRLSFDIHDEEKVESQDDGFVKKSKISNESKLQQSPGGLLSPSASPGESSIEERKSELFDSKYFNPKGDTTEEIDLVLLRPPQPDDPINLSGDDEGDRDKGSAALGQTYSSAGERWRYTSSYSRPSD